MPFTQVILFSASLATLVAAAPQHNVARSNVVRRDNVISSSFTDSSVNGRLGQQGVKTTIQSGVTYWINGFSTHNLAGNIDNYGSLYISQTSALKNGFPYAGGMTSDWVGHDSSNGYLNNAGLIQFNDIGSYSAPTYDWYLNQVQNSGTIQWCGRGDTGGSTFQFYTDKTSTNNGLISYEQAFRNLGASFVWRNPALTTTSTTGSNMINNGCFRLINVVYHNVQNIYGTGCWSLGAGSVLYLEDGSGVFQNPSVGPTFSGQSILFADSTAALHMDTAVYSKNSNFGAQCYGFGAGNAIEFYETIKSFSYSASGTLSVQFISGNSVNIKLGAGYAASSFRKGRNPIFYNTAGYNAIFYDGPAPAQGAPSSCSVSAPVCSDLGKYPPGSAGPTSSSSVISSTKTSSVVKSSSSSAVSSSTSCPPSATSLSVSSSSSVVLSSSSSAVISSTASSSAAPITSTSSSAVAPSTSSSSTIPSSTSMVISSSSSMVPTTTAKCSISTTSVDPAYSPYYPALSDGYTTNPALAATSTTTANQPCVTQPEAGTVCGFINPLDPCAPQPDGFGPHVTPDTVSSFQSYAPFHASALNAPSTLSTCNGTYNQIFKDLSASVIADKLVGQVSLKTYDVSACASWCNTYAATGQGCQSFNIFVERDPSLNPTNNDSSADTVWGYNCPNPESMTTFKCLLFGGNITESQAFNQGQWREEFQIVVVGSDGYVLQG